MVNQSKINDPRYWAKWEKAGAVAYGRAYTIMDIEASKEEIEAELPRARYAARTPNQLEISVREVKDVMADRTTDPKLVRCLGDNEIEAIYPEKYLGPIQFKPKPKLMSKLKYILEAKYPNTKDNEKAAAEITDVTNYLYYAFGQDKPFYAEIIAKAPDREYHPWTND
jgi:hypothetical protein